MDRQVEKKKPKTKPGEYSILEPGEKGVSRRQEQLTMSNAAPRIDLALYPKESEDLG